MNKSLGSIVTVTWLSWIWSFDFFKKVCGGRGRSNCNFLRSLRSYFVVKSLHFLKESKYFSLSLSLLYYETKKSRKKLKKCTLKIEGFQSVILPWNNLQTCHSFGYVNSVCKIYVLLESKWRRCSVAMAFVLNYLEFWSGIFDVFGHIRNLGPFFF